jgi:hypothetical protein
LILMSFETLPTTKPLLQAYLNYVPDRTMPSWTRFA